MGKIADVQEVTLTKLVPYANNAKIHNDSHVERIAESIKAFGFVSPVLIDQDYNILAGHGRVLAAQKLEMTSIPCVFIEGLTETQKKAYILADNKLGEIAEWNMDILNEELQKLNEAGFNISLTGFDLDNEIQQELNGGVEISIDSLNDERFRYECPECGFRFN